MCIRFKHLKQTINAGIIDCCKMLVYKVHQLLARHESTNDFVNILKNVSEPSSQGPLRPYPRTEIPK